jgi:DNA-binding NarL/FixJ family response regulator
MDVRMPVLDGIEATRQIMSGTPAANTRVIILTTFDLDEYVFGALRAGASGFLLKDTLPADLITAIRVVAAGDALLAPSVTRRLISEFARTPPLGATGPEPPSLPELRSGPGAAATLRETGRQIAAEDARRAGAAQAGTAQAETGHAGAAQAGTVPSGAAQARAAQAETGQAGAVQGGTGQRGDRVTALLTYRECEVLRLVTAGLSNAEIAEHLHISPATAKTHVAHLLTKLDARDRVQLVIIAYQAGLVTP